jgi:group I intron endonuclease
MSAYKYIDMTCGIYCIKNKINNKVYVGSSTNCENRFKQHKFKFLSNSHPNKHFQTSIIKYGLDNFSFEILETCLEDNLLINEDKWIKELNALNPKNGYNKKTANRIVWADELKRNHLNAVQTDEYRKLQQKITLSKWNNSRKNMFSKQFKEKWDKTESKNRNKRFNEWRGSDKQKEIMRIKTKARLRKNV